MTGLYDISEIEIDGRVARYVKIAAAAAMKSKHHQHRLGAVLIRGGKIISIGYNFSYVHAENTAINRAWRGGTDGAIAVVIRVRRDGSFGTSRPCDSCTVKLMNAGVRRVIFIDNDGILKSAKIPNNTAVQSNIQLQTMIWYKKEAHNASAFCV